MATKVNIKIINYLKASLRGIQIKDDLIDYTGKSRIVGKPTKSDLKKGKATLINLIGYDKTLLFANNLKRNIDKKITNFSQHTEGLLESVNFILDRKF